MNGRDDRGRFTPGNKFGKGAPTREEQEKYRKRFFRKVGDDGFDNSVTALKKRAGKGDVPAIKLILDHMMGTPVQRNENANIEMSPEEWAEWAKSLQVGDNSSGRQPGTNQEASSS